MTPTTSGGLSHSVSHLAPVTYPRILVTAADFTLVPSGKPVSLYVPAGTPVVGLSVAKSLVGTCSPNKSGAPTTPTATITHSGGAKGSTVTIKVNGPLWCNDTQTWEPFTYTATGILR